MVPKIKLKTRWHESKLKFLTLNNITQWLDIPEIKMYYVLLYFKCIDTLKSARFVCTELRFIPLY